MKKTLVAALLVTVTLLAQVPPLPRQITLEWDYPTNELSHVVFHVHHSADIATPLTNWLVLVSITNATKAKLTVLGGVDNYAVGVSNFWGESFSAVVSTPVLPRSDIPLKVQRAD